MKSIIFSLLLLLPFTLKAQDFYIFEYHENLVTFHDIRNAPKIPISMEASRIDAINRYINGIKGVSNLYVHNNRSLYKFDRQINPEEFKNLKSSGVVYALSYYKDFIDDVLIGYGGRLRDGTIIKENASAFNQWKHTSRDSIIRGFECKMAINENDGSVAWYTPEIPLPEGPLFHGKLPGLIILLIRGNDKIEMVGIKKEIFDLSIFDLPKTKRTIKYSDFETIRPNLSISEERKN
ncbi:MAG: GLPGLI family protein [Saprospiraceae bacterium]